MQSQDWYGNTSLAESLAGQLSNQLSISEPSSSWLGAYLVTSNFLEEDEFLGESEQRFNYKAGSTSGVRTGSSGWAQAGNYNFVINSPVSDDGDATYTISGTTTSGQTLSTSATTNDPDGNGTISSYTWQSSSDGSSWTTVGTSATYTLTTSEEGKYIRLTVAYTDGENFSESVTAVSYTHLTLPTKRIV